MHGRGRWVAGGIAVVVLAAVVVIVGRRDSSNVRADQQVSSSRSSTAATGTTSTTAASTTTTTAPSTTAAPTSESLSPTTPATPGPPDTEAPPDTAPAGPGLGDARVTLTPVANIGDPIAGAVWPGDPSSLYIASREGGVYRVRGGVTGPLLTVATTTDGERGLLGLAFTDSAIFVSYTNGNGDNQLDRYPMNGDGTINTAARSPLLTVAHPTYSNHNGGGLVLGPGGFLYWGLGDGGGSGDPFGNAQNLGTYRGKLVQVNPATGAAAIADWGLRNPWRFSFDLLTGDLYIGDVGQNLYEEIDWLPAGAITGANFGWNAREGLHPYNGGARPSGNVDPIWEYSHNDGAGRCAVTGGYVYRGSRIPALAGAYLFSDFCGGELHALLNSGGTVVAERDLGVSGGGVASFAQDAAGELYVLSFNGVVYRIDPA